MVKGTRTIQPLPWTAKPMEGETRWWRVVDAQGFDVLDTVTKAEAAFIVQACNAAQAVANVDVDSREDGPYRPEIDQPSCDHCGRGATWHVVGPNNVADGRSWENEDDAEDLAAALNEAYRRALGDAAARNA